MVDDEPLSFVPVRAPGVSSRLVQGLAIAVTEADQTLHTFDGPVATHIWLGIDGVSTVGDLLDDVLSHFEVQRGAALDDLLEFVQRLKASGLIEAAPANPAQQRGEGVHLK